MGVQIKVLQDHDAESPRIFDNLGVMACWHRRYSLGDVQPKEEPGEWLKEHAPTGSVVLPLFLYDHSGITMSTSPFACPWDSGQVGVIVATPEAIRKTFMVKRITKNIRDRATEVLVSEVQVYNDYLTGNVWGYVIDGDGDDEDDSCWGFFGSDALDRMKKDHVDPKYHEALEAAWENRS